MAAPVIECISFGPGWELELQAFLLALHQGGESRFFFPHPADLATLSELATRQRQDLHCLLVDDRRVMGYGLLRGWDEGYAIPSLGIAIHPQARSMGLGSFLMEYLETMAARRGAAAIRLRVRKENLAAIGLYSHRQYQFSPDPGDDDLLVGLKSLGRVRQ